MSIWTRFHWIVAGILLASSAVQSQPTSQPTRTFVGRVVSPEHKPVAGAEVTFIESGEGWDYRVAGKATTDADGRFSYVTQSERTEAIVTASGYGMTAALVRRTDQDDSAPETELHPPAALKAHFVGPDEKPAAGVRISISLIADELKDAYVFLPRQLQANIEQVTDADGACTFANLSKRGSARLAVSDDRFAELSIENLTLSDDAVTDIGTMKLAAAAMVAGRVVYSDTGKPAIGVLVGAQMVRGGGGTSDITDAQGNYVLKKLVAGEYDIALDQQADWGKRYVAVAHEKVLAHAGEHLSGIDFVLSTEGATIIGKATIKETGNPLPGIYIGVYGPAHPKSGAWVQSGRTAADGTFTARVPPGAQYVYVASQPPSGLISPAQISYDLSIQANQIIMVNFEFSQSPYPAVTGRVMDLMGNPVANAVIVVRQASENQFGGQLSANSDANGKFTIPGVQTGATILASKADQRSDQPRLVTDDNRDMTLIIRQFEPASALIKVVGPDGKPISGVNIELIKEEAMGRGFIDMPVARQKTAADGTFLFKSLEPDGTYSINAGGNGFTKSYVELKLVEGKQHEYQVAVQEAKSFVGGMVVDAAGKPVEGVEVFTIGRGERRTTQTDSKGRFKFASIAPGEIITVTTSTEVGLGERIDIQAGHDDAVVVYIAHAAKYPFGTPVQP